MATTGNNFLKVSATTLSGTAVLPGATTPYIEPCTPDIGAFDQANNGGLVVDKVDVDLSLNSIPVAGSAPNRRGTYLGNYALNGCVELALSGTTAQTIDLTNTTTNSPASYAGDTAFNTTYTIVFNNLGAGAVVVTTGATNPSGNPAFNGTSAGITVPANSIVIVNCKAGVTVDSTHKLIVCTPAATTNLCVSIGGA